MVPARSDRMCASGRKCVAKKTLALLRTSASEMARAMASPSRVLVPRPSSSMMALLARGECDLVS